MEPEASPAPQPTSQPAAEQVVSQWDQPQRSGVLSSKAGLAKLLVIAVPLAAILFGLAFWQKELNYGLVGAIVLVAVFAVWSQNRAGTLQVAVTTTRIIIGKREHLLVNLAGFWLDNQGDVIEINIESKKAGLLPVTFLYATPSLEEARQVMSQVLPELQPREKRLGDKVGNYFRL